MRRKLTAGLIVALGVAGGAATLAQVPKRGSPQPPEPAGALLPPAQVPKAAPDFEGLASPGEPTLAPAEGPFDAAPANVPPEDPMEAVESFVQRSRKEAEDATRSLSEERDRLRERLTKVEAALARWEQVSKALAGDGHAVAPDAGPPTLDLRPAGDTPKAE